MNYPRHTVFTHGIHPISICPPPATGESVASWIDRISAANDYPKSWAYHVLGLAPSEHWRAIKGGQHIYLPAEHATTIAAATGQPTSRIQKMTITGAYGDSGLLTPPPADGNHRQWALLNPILVSRSRYCPQCLNNDGGVWKLEWRVEHVTTCPTHQLLLNHTCPNCGQPAASGRQAGNSLNPVFITQPATPTHCMNTLPAPIAQPGRRSAPCGHPLTASPTIAASPEALETDTRLRQQLATPAAQWWNDFVAVTSPILANLHPDDLDRIAPNNTFTRHEKTRFLAHLSANDERYAAGRRRTNSETLTDPAPLTIVASLAARIVDGDDALFARLLATKKNSNSGKQSVYQRIYTNTPSPTLLTRMEHLAAETRNPAARHGFSRTYRHAHPPLDIQHLNPDGIPPYLWYDIFDEHLGDFHTANPKMRYDTFRKAASVAVYKLATGTTWRQASQRFLDTEIVSDRIGRNLTGSHTGADRDHILSTIRTIAEHPATQTRTQNHQQTRAAADQLFAEPVTPATARRLLNKKATLARRTHLAAYAWAYTTGSIPYHSPAWASIATTTEESARERYRQWRDHDLPTVTQTIRQWAATQLPGNGFTSLPTVNGQFHLADVPP